jgi:formylglycine-generating enzyme required for sulfatase activity
MTATGKQARGRVWFSRTQEVLLIPRKGIFALALCFALSSYGFAQDSAFHPHGEQIDAPPCDSIPDEDAPRTGVCSERVLSEWLTDIQHWRQEKLVRIGYEDANYEHPEFQWAQSSFVQTQTMIEDRYFYDPTTGTYTVDRYLDDLKQRYGGVDSVLIWHVYPNLGVDNRNQFDLFRDLPGGTEGVKKMVAQFHARGVRVLFPVVIWDEGTRAEGKREWEVLAKEISEVGADGINGDTLEGVPRVFHLETTRLGRPLLSEPEAGLASGEMLNYNVMSWAYLTYGFAPPVSLFKWLEPRHMVHVCNRWAHDHTDDLQAAFFNGTGFESWENVWGIWNQMTPRDAETLRRIMTIERANAALLTSAQWEPNVLTHQVGVFASKWPGKASTLWTMVNRNAYAVSDGIFETPVVEGARYFDLWHGVELHPKIIGANAWISLEMEPNGYGAVLETRQDTPIPTTLLDTMHALSLNPLASFSKEWKTLPQQVTPIAATRRATTAPDGMVKIPAGDFQFEVHGIELEGMNDEGADVQYPWENSPRRYHSKLLHMDAFWIDRYPVTNAQFKSFLDASHYHPADDHNFLKDWVGDAFPAGWANKPVTWVSLEDARAYAAWAGKRLPHEWEWQYAAQGTDSLDYPWDRELTPGATVPRPDKGRIMQPPSDVDAHPRGASPLGVWDLTGNVWQWTDEFVDEHTRAAILRGGSHYEPQGSKWYFPQAYRLSEHGKYLLTSPGMDRSGTIGFRCVVDAG